MSSYPVEFLEEAMPLLWLSESKPPQTAREQGMPRAKADPRTAVDGMVSMIDVRRAWEQCEWLSFEERQAIMAMALLGTSRLAGWVVGVDQSTILRRRAKGLEAMSLWLNTTVRQREFWHEQIDLELEAKLSPYTP